MNLLEQSYAAMRLLLSKPMSATTIALVTGREVRHVKRGMKMLADYRMVSSQNTDGICYYSLTPVGLDALCERDGVKYTVKYVTTGRIHPRVDWPWTYREAA